MTEKVEYMLIVEIEHDPLIHNEDFIGALSSKLTDIVKEAGLIPLGSGLMVNMVDETGEGA